MTVVSGTTPQTSSSSSSSTASATNSLANQQIAGNFQSFLQLLTTQLQNQNSLSPLDTNQFTQQLVEFAGVQQQINTNDSLATLVSLQQTAQSSQALEFVGKTAVVKGSTTSLTNSEAAWGLNIASASTVTINITNSTGATVYIEQHRRQRRQQPDLHLERAWHRRHPAARRHLHAHGNGQGFRRQLGWGLNRNPGRGLLGRPHPVAAAVVDRRPDLHGQSGPEHRKLAKSGARASSRGPRRRLAA